MYRLVGYLGKKRFRILLKPGDNFVGSDPDADIRLQHPTISRRHAVIHVSDASNEIEDLGSHNGTRIGETKLQGRKPLSAGEVLRFGGLSVIFEEVDDDDVSAAVTLTNRRRPKNVVAAADPTKLTTISTGILDDFTLIRLPEILSRLIDDSDMSAVAPAVGAMLFESIPCAGVTVANSAGGLLFSANRDKQSEPHDVTVNCQKAGLQIQSRFFHARMAETYRPLVEIAAMLIDLAAGRQPPDLPTEKHSPPPRQPLPDPPSIDPKVCEIYAQARRIAEGDISVLILGESGTGKEVLARFIHSSSPRHGEGFVALNCAALPQDLLEAELFGVEKGAATGVQERPGKFELAHRGSLFLDEIGDMALATQAKILRVLQEREIFRLGGIKAIPIDVRIIAASNRDVRKMQQEKRFRQDLYHRIADWVVCLPKLIDRGADIANLAVYFLERQCRKRGVQSAGISKAALRGLECHFWPGNIRQLEREMARVALMLEDGDLVELADLQPQIREQMEAEGESSLRARLAAEERRVIRQALARHSGDVALAAAALDVPKATLYRRMKKLIVEPTPR